MAKRVLIAGARGMLGQELVRAFSAWEVIAKDRGEVDITKKEAVQQVVTDARPTLIVNAAAYNAVDAAEHNQNIANRVNGEAVGYLAEAATAVGATFVHYSTDYVFDGKKKEGYRENEAPNPLSAYGRSKLLGEQKIQNSEFRIQNYYLIRTSRLFGNVGTGKKSFIDLMLEKAQSEETIEVVDEEYSSPTYVRDLALRTKEMIEQKKPSGVYHLTNHGACTWYGFAWEIFKQAEALYRIERIPRLVPVSGDTFPRPAKRPAYSQLLNTKFPSLRPWQEALREYLHRMS